MARPRRVLITAALLVSAVPGAHAAVPGTTLLVDLPQGAGPGSLTGQNNRSSTQGERTLSADGNRVLFTSSADGLSASDDNRLENLFVRDRVSNETILVNVGLGGAPADDAGVGAQISGDGGKVVFFSDATNLVGGLPAGTSGIYLRDLAAGTTQLVSRADGAGGPPAGLPASPAISQDGSTIAFITETSLDAADTNGTFDVYVRKLAANDTILASRADTLGGAVGSAPSASPSLSANGDAVAFESNAPLAGEAGVTDTNGLADVYRRTLAGQTRLMSRREASPTAGDSISRNASISPDGVSVAFESRSTNLDAQVADVNGSTDVYVRAAAATNLASRADGVAGALGSGDSYAPAAGLVVVGNKMLVSFTSGAAEITGGPDGLNQIVLRNVTDGVTEVISRNGPAIGDRGSRSSAVNADASRVAYATDAANLGASSSGGFAAVLLRDRAAGTTELISRPPGNGALAGDLEGSDLDRGRRTISADGRYVVFFSGSNPLLGALPGDRFSHVFRKDLLTGELLQLDRPDGGGSATRYARAPSMSADGNIVAFETASALVPGDGNGRSDVYVRDVAAGTTRLVSRASGPAGAVGNDHSGGPVVSGDGVRVAFESEAMNLGDGDADPTVDVHLRDLLTTATTLVSRADGPGGAKGNSSSGDPSIDADGSVVAFESGATNLADGDTDNLDDVHVRDLAAGTTRLASRASGADGAQGLGSSSDPTISADGLRVAFESSGANLVPEDADTESDILLRDLATATTTLISRADGPGGAAGDDASSDPSISADGAAVAFETNAPNLGGTSSGDRVVLRRPAAGSTVLVSRADGVGGAPLAAGESATDAGISGDGSCAVFESDAGTLLPAGVSADFTRIHVRVLARECPFDPPETAITTGPSGTVATPANTFAFASDEPGSRFECRLDGAPFTACGTPLTTAALADGAHLFEARATDAAGFQDATPAQRAFSVRRAVPRDTTRPRLTSVSLTRKRFRVGPKATAVAAATRRSPIGTTVRYTLSETATVRMVIARRESGRRVGSSCRKATRALRKRKRCTRFVARGTLRRASRAGANRVAFSGRIGRRALPRGTYRMTLTATDPAGNRSAARTLRFTVLKR